MNSREASVDATRFGDCRLFFVFFRFLRVRLDVEWLFGIEFAVVNRLGSVVEASSCRSVPLGFS